MQFKFATLVSAVALASSALAQTVSYEGFASTVSCSGSSFGCTDGGSICCSLPSGFGFSAQFNNLPSGTEGQGYTGSGCSDFLFSLFGSGTKCFNGGGTRATHLNWFHSTQGRRRAPGQAREAGAAAAAANCSSPAYFKYADASSAERTIKVPADEGAAQTIADLYIASNLTALSTYANY
ncbi:hypothetical protein BJ912DRAFT_901219 [Pholiota molesta]|nr:hypothetical protein BJ912DRAFT_901219 [Pholiota molesta]